MPKKMNRLNIRSKKQAIFSRSLLSSNKFRRSRGKTKAGKRLFNEEIDIVKDRFDDFDLDIKKKFPRKFSV